MTTLDQLERLPVSERLQLVEDLWDSIARSNADFPVPQWQKGELARRREKFERHPESALPWSEVKRNLLNPS